VSGAAVPSSAGVVEARASRKDSHIMVVKVVVSCASWRAPAPGLEDGVAPEWTAG
tara:strand:+ start:364 stop:528 length:165 start_codon:yes stop_codon:yes gene_type:complete